jgi:hypothetical protein
MLQLYRGVGVDRWSFDSLVSIVVGSDKEESELKLGLRTYIQSTRWNAQTKNVSSEKRLPGQVNVF